MTMHVGSVWSIPVLQNYRKQRISSPICCLPFSTKENPAISARALASNLSGRAAATEMNNAAPQQFFTASPHGGFLARMR